VAFYYYLDQKDKFNKNTAIMTALISFSFMIRTTSPTGWIPLLAYKVLKEGSFVPFLTAGFLVALPVCCLCVLVDTYMYGADEWVITGYNFYRVNLAMGLSNTFGMDDFWYYWRVIMPVAIEIICPYTYLGILFHYKAQSERGQVPYLMYFTLFYIFFFSAVGHKEERFLLPVWSYLLMFTGEF